MKNILQKPFLETYTVSHQYGLLSNPLYLPDNGELHKDQSLQIINLL